MLLQTAWVWLTEPSNALRLFVTLFLLYMLYDWYKFVWAHADWAKVPGIPLWKHSLIPRQFLWIEHIRKVAIGDYLRNYNLQQHYGDIFRQVEFGPAGFFHAIGVCDAEIIDRLYIDQRLTKPYVYTHFFNYLFNNHLSVLSATAEPHRKQRRLLAPPFSFQKVRHSVDQISVVLNDFMDLLQKLNKKGEPFDIQINLQRLTSDVIGEVAFGGSFNSIQTGESSVVNQMNFILQCTPLGILFGFVGDIVKDMVAGSTRKALLQHCQNIVDKRKAIKSPPQDLLQACIDAATPLITDEGEKVIKK